MAKKYSASNKPIKAFLFDLGKVILDFDFTPAFKRLSRFAPMTPDEIRGFFTRSGLEVLYDGGKLSSLEFYRKAKKGLGHSLSYSEFKEIWNRIFTPKPEIIGLVKRLSPHYRMVLISNTNSMHYRYIRSKYAVLNHFDQIILSFKERVRKPDTRIYEKAIKACKARPEEIVYIDDREDLTTSARTLGVHIFTYKNNPHELLKQLRSLQIGKI